LAFESEVLAWRRRRRRERKEGLGWAYSGTRVALGVLKWCSVRSIIVVPYRTLRATLAKHHTLIRIQLNRIQQKHLLNVKPIKDTHDRVLLNGVCTVYYEIRTGRLF